jgi:predicted ribosome quality control (RQC) complex YloA/Tae2 family protein
VLSLTELERVARALEARIAGARVQALVQPDADSVVLTLYRGGTGRVHVRLSCRPGSARASELAAPPPAPPQPPAFAQYLRAHVLGARVADCALRGGDRQLAIRLEAREGVFELLLALLGRRSNLLLLGADDGILAALRPLAETRPELEPGGRWQDPASRPPRAGEDRFAGVPEAGLLEAIEEHYAAAESEDEGRALRRRLEQALLKETRALDRKLEKVERELADAEAAIDCERQGQLLKSVLRQVKAGDTSVVAHDFETGEPVEIALDPRRSPTENLDALFKRYRKALRTLTRGGAQQEVVSAERAALSGLQKELGALDESALAGFAARPEVARLLERHAPAERPPPPRRGPSREMEKKLAGQRVPGRLAPRRYRTAGDLEIWVGRSDAGNDHLTTRLARGNDLFFHLDGAPGSHVVLRTGGRTDPPSEALLDACELAVHFSKAKNASRADVHVVPIKNVRKPKGAKPGLVTVHGGRTVHLRRTPARLARLLESRLDD